MNIFRRHAMGSLLLTVLLVTAPLAARADSPRQSGARAYEQMVARAVNFLKTKGQAEDGSYSRSSGIGVTALVATAILRHGRSPDDPLIAKSLSYLTKHIQADGGIYKPGTLYRNYETCLAILCLTGANRDGRYDKTLKRASAFIKGLQWDEGEGKGKTDTAYGGAGYGKHQRPDLSNTAFLVEALKAGGDGANSEAIQRALVFISRCQNLETEHNTTPHAAKNPDGGLYYTAAEGGSSQAGLTESGGLRSYGSMTYAGLKSMIYAGVGPDDARVKAAYRWIQRHYDLNTNPGLGSAGLYYYYHTFAKALDALDKDQLIDAQGNKHNWRAELAAELARRQQPSGAWINQNARWMEGDANLATGYALLALSYCRPEKQ